jgi:hypothetical protein
MTSWKHSWSLNMISKVNSNDPANGGQLNPFMLSVNTGEADSHS